VKIGVLIRTFNRPELLVQSLASLSLQTVDDWEVIIFDDMGSQENFNIYSQFKKSNPTKRIVYVTSMEARDFYKHFWRCSSSLSKSDVLVKLDDDDLLSRDCLEFLLSVYENHPEIDFTYGSTFRFKDDKLVGQEECKTPHDHPPTPHAWAGYLAGPPYNNPWHWEHDYYQIPQLYSSIIHASKAGRFCVFNPQVFRKSSVEKISNKIDITSNWADDLEFSAILEYLGLCYTSIKKKIAYYRHHNLQRVTSESLMSDDVVRVRDHVDSKFRPENFSPNIYTKNIEGNNWTGQFTQKDSEDFSIFLNQINDKINSIFKI